MSRRPDRGGSGGRGRGAGKGGARKGKAPGRPGPPKRPLPPDLTDAQLAEAIASGAERLDVPLTAEAVAELAELVRLLEAWNVRINVVGPAPRSVWVERHVLDGLALCRLLDRVAVARDAPDDGRWFDVGAGAGLPGLVVAAARPGLRVTCVEPIAKKIAFARHAVDALGWRDDRVRVHVGRVEEVPRDADRPTAAWSRATFAPERWVELGRELVGPGGWVVALLGGDRPVAALEAEATLVDRVTLPSGAGRVNLALGPVANAAEPAA